MRLRTFLRGTGKTLISAGLLILAFVAYQLWGTGLAEARSQSQLKKQFDAAIRAVPTTKVPPTTVTTPETTTTGVPLPPPPTGGAIAILTIPRIGVDVAVVEGVGVSDLKKGPGHYPKTPLPGQPGNTAIAGHRTTYGAPFYHLDEVQPGDDLFVHTEQGPTYHYQVMFQHNVDPTDVSVIESTPDNRLTLTTCTPRFSARQRLIVVSKLLGPANAPPTRRADYRDVASDTPTVTPAAPVRVGGLSGEGTSTIPAVLWGLLCALLWIGGHIFGRVWRRWPAYAVTAPFFLLALFVFFENFARFVPANI